MDDRQYGHYKQLSGRTFQFGGFSLRFDSVQSDAFAPPSKICVRVDKATAQFPRALYSNKARSIASAHYIARHIHAVLARLQSAQAAREGPGGWHAAKGGKIAVDCPGQEVIERTAVVLSDSGVTARLTASLPAAGRTVLGHVAQHMLLKTLPQLVDQAMRYPAVSAQEIESVVLSAEDQEHLRAQLGARGLAAFVGNGSILPRSSGVSNMPLISKGTVRFQSPASLEVAVELPNQGTVTGMGIPCGVTLICGGGFNGKSTLLQAIERGVYNHAPGDGRELVSAEAAAVKIKAEEGRAVCNTDIRPFINNLPLGKDTSSFSTSDASGSTSMAASIQEAIEAGASTLLFDEDTCATNFLVRDGRMQRLVAQDKEPITPLVSRVRELWEAKKVSSILVIGGCGDYLDVADTVIGMDGYAPLDMTAQAKAVAQSMPVVIERPPAPYGPVPGRLVHVPRELVGHKPPKTKTRWTIALFPSGSLAEPTSQPGAAGDAGLGVGEPELLPELDLSALDQLVSASQTRSIACMLHMAALGMGRITMRELLKKLDATALDALGASHGAVPGDLARPRAIE
ncbi:hypothetical protein GGF46_003785, partial [Coemansia sp. RSA 552]